MIDLSKPMRRLMHPFLGNAFDEMQNVRKAHGDNVAALFAEQKLEQLETMFVKMNDVLDPTPDKFLPLIRAAIRFECRAFFTDRIACSEVDISDLLNRIKDPQT